jgi:hypothetical protein
MRRASMGQISDKDRSIFREAYNTVLDNLTEDEQSEIDRLAGELQRILEAAKGRQQEEPGNAGR